MAKKVTRKYPCETDTTRKLTKFLGVQVLAEVSFHPTRKWRFDYAVPEWKIAVEKDGGIFTGGRHSGGINQLKDMEKMNEAVKLGWRILHYTPEQMGQLIRVAGDIRETHINDLDQWHYFSQSHSPQDSQ